MVWTCRENTRKYRRKKSRSNGGVGLKEVEGDLGKLLEKPLERI